MVVKSKILYVNNPDERGVDLRPFGVDCIPYLGQSRFTRSKRGTVYHVHPGCVEICLCRKGRLLFESEGECFPFLPGSIFVSNPDQPHRMRTYPKGLVISSLLFKIPGARASVLGLPLRESQFLSTALTHFRKRVFHASDRVKEAFARIFEVFDSGTPDDCLRRIEMRSAALNLLLAVVESANAKPLSAHSIFTDLSELMLRRPQDAYPIAQLARQAALSEFAFSESFKHAVGLPPHAWLVDCRIRAAKELLRTSAKSIACIAREVGFRSTPHFISTFKLTTGITPLQYRKHREKERKRLTASRATPPAQRCGRIVTSA